MKTVKNYLVMRKLTDKDVEFRITVEQEDDLNVRGNVMASGDDDADLQAENEVIERLNRGDYTAWCCVRVTARWNGFEGFAGIGACSFAEGSNEQIEAHEIATEYDLAGDALADLNEKIESILAHAAGIESKLS